MKDYRNNSITSNRNSYIEKLNKKESSIKANKQSRNNAANLSFSRVSDGYKQKLGNVKTKIDNQFKVIRFKFSNEGL